MNPLNILELIQAILGAAEQIVPIFVHKNGQTQAVVVTNPAGAAQLQNTQPTPKS